VRIVENPILDGEVIHRATIRALPPRFQKDCRGRHPIPEPGPGEVLVKVAYCGICHSDLSLINGTFPAQRPVVTQGHEASGRIGRT
jgi:D-arabinose 1-dehydrogenase-like Zn-dependent alcohol dehydrogenase